MVGVPHPNTLPRISLIPLHTSFLTSPHTSPHLHPNTLPTQPMHSPHIFPHSFNFVAKLPRDDGVTSSIRPYGQLGLGLGLVRVKIRFG